MKEAAVSGAPRPADHEPDRYYDQAAKAVAQFTQFWAG
jgi:hypothetical protein